MKKLATLEVWVDENETDRVSALESCPDIGRYRVLLRPNADEKALQDGITTNKVATILAHELGHFVGYVMQSPWQTCPYKVPGEKEAWSIAHLIKPDLDITVETHAIDTYTKNHCTCGRSYCPNQPPPKEIRDHCMDLYEKTKLV